MSENPSKMNINKFEVICSRRLAEECDATLNRECHTLVCSEENIDNRRKENEDDTGNRREGNGKDHLDSCYKDEKNPSKMNTNRFKVIFTKRLAKDECDATLNPEFQTVVCSEDDFDNRCKENEDDTNNWLKGNEDNTDNRQKENEDDIDNPHKGNEDNTNNQQKENEDDIGNPHKENEDDTDNLQKENEDDTDNWLKGNEDNTDNRQKENEDDIDNPHKENEDDTDNQQKENEDDIDNPHKENEDDTDNLQKENEDDTDNWLKGNEDNTDNRQKENEDDIDNPHKENEDDTDNLQKENEDDTDKQRKVHDYEKEYIKLVNHRPYDPDGSAVKRNYPFSVIDFIVVFLSVIFFIIDVVTDIMLAKDYYNDGLMLEFALTSSFVTGSFLVTGILSSIWHAYDEKKEIEKKKRNYRNICYLILRFPFATIERYIKYAIHGCKSKQKGSNKFYHYVEMIYTDIDGSFLRMVEAFIESVPQLILQIYLILREQENLKNCEDIEVHSDILRMLTILSSCVSISWSVTAYYQVIRGINAIDKTHQKTLLSSAGYFLWRIFEIGSRVMALVMMILINPIIFVLIVVFHWFAVITRSFATKAIPYKKFHENAIFFVFVGFVQVFSFMNITAGPSRSNAWLYYTFFYFENIVILILWIIVKKESYCPWIYYGTIGIVSSSIVFTVVFIACFYKLCHPKIGILKEY